MATDEFHLDRSRVGGLLGVEESSHPWASGCSTPFSFPLLRTWDGYSGSQPNEQNRMNSRAPHESLATFESRQKTLAMHINHHRWENTPYISFTSSPRAVQELAESRVAKRGPQTVTVIDPVSRSLNGLPILDLATEMEHYDVPNPYGSREKYCKDHYICLWQVTEDEIIHHWRWDELSKSENWYEEIIMPAFRRFRRASLKDTSDLSTAVGRLCLTGGSPDQASIFREEFDSETGNNIQFSEDSGEDSEGIYYNSDDDWDTDDEAEEQNASDDIIKIIEGDF